jgi:predicted DsbA family dithiol-disulfide isomerase
MMFKVVLAQELGISGVPTYILDDKDAIVGAQPYEAFQRVLARLAGEASEPHPDP